MLTYVWYFYIYAFLGWCVEVVYAAVNRGVFVNRGFLNGPLCPIYGFGVTAVLAALTPLKENLLLLYAGSVLLTSALELATGFVMDKLFHHKWWDYSSAPANVGGYICLKFSLLWGLACVLVVDAVQPTIAALVTRIPDMFSYILLAVFTGALLADLAVTVASIRKLNRRLGQLDEIARTLRRVSDMIGENVAGNTIAAEAAREKAKAELLQKRALLDVKRAELAARRDELTETIRSEHKRLLHAFPDLTSRRHPETLEHVKSFLKRKFGDRDEK